MHKIIVVISLILFTQNVIGQKSFPIEQYLSQKSLVQKQKDFSQWSQQNNLEQTKGWKWYSRWIEEQSRRANGRGEISDQAPLFDAAIAMSASKSAIQFRDQAANWSPVGPNTKVSTLNNSLIIGVGRINTIEFHPTDPNTFWVGVAQGGIWKTTNSGQSWTPLTDNLPITRISDIEVDPNNPDIMYISVGDYAYFGVGLKQDSRKRHTHYGLGVYKSIDGGISWNPTGLTYELSTRDLSLIRRVFVSRSNSNNIVAAGIDGIWNSFDGGDSWTKVHEGQISDFERHPTNNNIIYASTANRLTLNRGTAGLWKSSDFGASWTELNSGIPTNGDVQRIELTISTSNPDYIYALSANKTGGFYGLYQSKDGGQSWNLQSTQPNIMDWGDGNGSQSGQGFYDLTILVDDKNPEKIYTGGVNIWGSNDGGQSWRPASYWLSSFGPSVHADQHYLAYNPLDKRYYLCNDGGVYRTDEIIFDTSWEEIDKDDEFRWPTKWEELHEGIQATSFYRLSVSRQNDDIIAGAQDNSTYFRRDDTWFNIIGGDGMECIIDPNDPNIIYGSSQYGRIRKSTNRGQSFFNFKRNIPSRESSVWTTPFFVDADDPLVAHIGLSNIWRTIDGGDSWDQLSDFRKFDDTGRPGPIGHFNVAASDPDKIYAAKRIYFEYNEPSSFMSTVDGGETWEDYTEGLPDSLYFNYVISDDINSETVWVSIGGFTDGVKVFKSINAGKDWENISFNLPNIPVNCLAKDPNSKLNTIYAGTDIGVYYMNDNAEEWLPFSDQLPNVIVSELEIHSGKNKIYAATFGRGIWVSDLLDETPTSVQNRSNNNIEIKISPSVNNGQFEATIKIQTNEKSDYLTVDIVNIMGAVMKTDRIANSINKHTLKYNLDLLSGQYYIRVSKGKKMKALPFIIK